MMFQKNGNWQMSRPYLKARRYSGGKSAALSAVHLLEWRNFRPAKKNAAEAEIPTKAVRVRCHRIRADGKRRKAARRRHGHDATGAAADLGRSLTGQQSSQAAPQARNYRWIAAWQVLSSACTNLNI